MTMTKLREVLRAKPFRSFWLCLADGREVRVAHPEFIAMSPLGRDATVYSPRGELEIIDLLLVTGISYRRGMQSGDKRKKRRSA